MKIAMVGNFGLWHKGTMGARALPMAKALVAAGHEVCLIIPPWDDPRQSGVEHQIDGVRVANVKLPPRVPLLWHALLAASLLRRTLQEPFDVVHIFKPKAYSGLVQMALAFLRRVRALDFRIVLDTDDWEGKGGWNELETFPLPVKWLIGWHEAWCLRHADAVSVASRALESIVLAMGVPGRKVFYAPNGVWDFDSRRQSEPSKGLGRTTVTDEDFDGSSESALDGCSRILGPHPTLLLYTRFFEFKVQRVVDIFSAVRQKLPEAKLLVVGRGLRDEQETLARLVRDAGLGADVRYVGWVKAVDLPKWFELADVAIYPMDDTLLNRAKCPMKLVDLMSCGVPVVADRVGQVAEYVEDGVSGVLVTPGEVGVFSDAVVGLLLNADRRRGLGVRARERVRSAFEWRGLIDNVEKAYGIDPTYAVLQANDESI